MLIGIDGNEANVKERVGIGVYAFELLRQFRRTAETEKVDFKIYLKHQPLSDLPQENGHWQYVVFGPKPFWTQLALPARLWWEKLTGRAPEVFFSPSHYAPRFCPVPSAISVMDLSFLHFPKLFTKKDLWQLRWWTSYSVKQARKIFTISNWSRNDIIKEYGVAPEKVEVTYLGHNRDKFKVQSSKFKVAIRNLKLKYSIDGDYVIFVGTLQPRKNLERLLLAFKKIISLNSLKNSPKLVNLKLVICGKRGWMFESIFAKVKELRMEDMVIFTGYVADEELASLLAGAKCFVLPSLYEGFGITVLEAMAVGTPVVVGNVSSLPEIVGGAGVLVDPYKVESIKEGILRAINDDGILVKKGLEQVEKFSWERCAKETLAILKTSQIDKQA